ncbi:p25-alpha [Plasmodiophora brassicae]|uniref:Uncharacterized protein n=1 Tax=Plasmodiophora brassicae TaxID=37360 RepID=A0A0G4J6D5_PLABS|nr:hypothetical protein PBRA_002818 [Plasmodiophora brassicae]SPQ94957.1 unnamed protein product [Plasmodiophora brassicae]
MSGSDAKKPSIFDKLTDTKHYTGTHQHRFDAAGRGRGLAGRDRVVKGVGTSDSPYDDGDIIRDLSQITRTNLRAKPTERPKSAAPKPEVATHRRCRETTCVNTCSPISKQGFCSYHMWQEKESAPFPKGAAKGATKERPQSAGRHQRQLSTSSLCHVPSCGNDRGSNNDGFCNYHQEQKQTQEKLEQSADAQAGPLALSGGRCIISNCSAAIYRMGYCQAHFVQMQDADGDQLESSNEESGTGDNKTGSKRTEKADPDHVLARLTDHKLYTGSHQHRFDDSGKGRGLQGRDYVAKGRAVGKYHGGAIHDISQILRQ